MYDVRWLSRVARDGLSDLLPAVRQAFDDEPDNDRLDQVFGRSPRAAIIGLSLACVLFGELWARLIPDLGINDLVHWPAVAVGLVFATIFRGYLFGSGAARVEDFPWLAASLVPAVALLGAALVLGRFAAAVADHAIGLATITELLGGALADALGVAAAVVISVATLCYSGEWLRALRDLALRLLMFKLMVFVTTLVLLEIGIVGPIVSGILSSIFDLHIPEWIPELMDQLTYVGLMGVIYLAVIGATWTVCRQSFAELLASGQVDVLATIAEMAQNPKKKQRREKKREQKAEKKRQKVEKKRHKDLGRKV